MLKLKLQYFGPLMWRANSLEKTQLIGEDPTHWRRPWCRERLRTWVKGMTEGAMVGWHHQLKEHEFEQTPGSCEGQGSVVCCSTGSQRFGHDWATKKQGKFCFRQIQINILFPPLCCFPQAPIITPSTHLISLLICSWGCLYICC